LINESLGTNNKTQDPASHQSRVCAELISFDTRRRRHRHSNWNSFIEQNPAYGLWKGFFRTISV